MPERGARILLISQREEDLQLVRDSLPNALEGPVSIDLVRSVEEGVVRVAQGGITAVALASDLALEGTTQRLLQAAHPAQLAVFVLASMGNSGAHDARPAKGSEERNLACAEIGQEQFRLLVQFATDLIITIDETSTIVFANSALERILGYRPAEVVGHKLAMLMPERMRARHQFGLQRHVESGRKQWAWAERVELVGLHKAGYEIPIELSLNEFTSEGRRLFVGAICDISSRKRGESQERARKRQQASVNRLLEWALAGMDFERLEHEAAAMLVEVLGVEWGAVLEVSGDGKTLLLREGVGWAPGVVGNLSVAATSDSFAGFTLRSDTTVTTVDLEQETRFSSPLAPHFGVRSGVSTVIPGERQPFGVLAAYDRKPRDFLSDEINFVQSIANTLAATAVRRRTEVALSESESRFRLFFEQHLVGNYITTPDGKLIACNQSLAKLLGCETTAQALQMDMKALYATPEAREDFVEQVRTLGKLERFESELLRRDGRTAQVVETAVGIFNPHGVLTEIHGFVLDVSQERHLQDQLRQAQKMEAVGRLAGGVAHDFNNLLTAIMGYSQLALMELKEGDPLHHNIEEISKAADRAASLTRQLLAFSRRQVLQPRVVDLNVILSDVERMLRRLIGEDVQLETRPDPALGRVRADAGQLEQVLLNLAVNARDAMPTGGRLEISTANVELGQNLDETVSYVLPGRYVQVVVRDNGSGMDASTRSRIFEPFFTTKERGKGTGLGLSTVYGIVKQSEGYIWVDSEPGQGAAFTICLPRVDATSELPNLREPVATHIERASETLLLVEDDDALRLLAGTLLRSSGYSVLEAARGAEAIALCAAQSGPIHLLLTDVVMPEMSGPELAQRLKDVRPAMRVLFMSGYTDDAIGHHGALDADVEFLEKPFTPDTLIKKVRKVLDTPT